MRIGELIGDAATRLEAGGVDEPRLKTETLLSDVLRCRRLELGLRSQGVIEGAQRETFERRVRRLQAGEPLQYVMGSVDFMGRIFKTDSRALIPRPETEWMVEQVLADERSERPSVALADVGTGSGCIIISLAIAGPKASCLATDTSAAALELARENAVALGVAGQIRFVKGDLLEGVSPASLDVVISNPPYVSTAEWACLPREIRDHEPRMALDGGPDGLAVISRLLPQAHAALRPAGVLWMEIGEDQMEGVLLQARMAGFANRLVLKDLAGRDRVFRGIKP
jgi:release factor glutamine methyltransferase